MSIHTFVRDAPEATHVALQQHFWFYYCSGPPWSSAMTYDWEIYSEPWESEIGRAVPGVSASNIP